MLSTKVSSSYLSSVEEKANIDWGSMWGCFQGTHGITSLNLGTSLAVQWLRLHISTTGGSGSILGWAIDILHATWLNKRPNKYIS